MRPYSHSSHRLFAAGALFSAWMLCLLVGWAAGGAIHLLLVVALVLFPWVPTTEETRKATGETKARDAPAAEVDEEVDEDQSASARSSSSSSSSSSS